MFEIILEKPFSTFMVVETTLIVDADTPEEATFILSITEEYKNRIQGTIKSVRRILDGSGSLVYVVNRQVRR